MVLGKNFVLGRGDSKLCKRIQSPPTPIERGRGGEQKDLRLDRSPIYLGIQYWFSFDMASLSCPSQGTIYSYIKAFTTKRYYIRVGYICMYRLGYSLLGYAVISIQYIGHVFVSMDQALRRPGKTQDQPGQGGC